MPTIPFIPQIFKTRSNIRKSKTFTAGNLICHENNYNAKFYCFFYATTEDVENYSGKNGYYYIKDNTEG